MMNFTYYLFVMLLLLLSSSAYSDDDLEIAALKRILREPSSAIVTDVFPGKMPGTKCGYVNSKNAEGKMTGPQLFAFDGDGAAVLPLGGSQNNGTTISWFIIDAARESIALRLSTVCGEAFLEKSSQKYKLR